MRRCGIPCRPRADLSPNRASRPASRRALVAASRAVLGAALLALSSGCVTKGAYDEVVDERDRLAKAKRELEGRVERLEAANQSFGNERVKLIDETEDLHVAKQQLESDLARLTREAEQLRGDLSSSRERLANREAEIEKMRSTYDVLVSDLEDEVAAGQIQIEKLRSGLAMNLSEEILFASGSAALNASGAAVLRKVGGRLNDLQHAVVVRGHTDDVPIAGRYPSNWELAAARASAVVRLLTEVGVDPARLTVVSRAEYEPVASNETREGRARNRRIEIRLEPVGLRDTLSANAPEEAEADESGGVGEAAPDSPDTAEGPPAMDAERAPES